MRAFNKIMHGIGYMFFMVGLIMCVGAAGYADLNYDLENVIRYGAAGMVACYGGLFLTRWSA